MAFSASSFLFFSGRRERERERKTERERERDTESERERERESKRSGRRSEFRLRQDQRMVYKAQILLDAGCPLDGPGEGPDRPIQPTGQTGGPVDVFPRMRSEGFLFNSGGLGVEPCSRLVV